MKSQPAKSALIEAVLTRAAEQEGDITPAAMALFYQRMPEARELFEHHGGGRVYNLEGEMVEMALYCLLHWFESPGEIEIMLQGSVPHHNDTLKVPPEAYQGLLQATAEVILETIPPGRQDELAIWREVCDDLAGLIEYSRRFVFHPRSP